MPRPKRRQYPGAFYHVAFQVQAGSAGWFSQTTQVQQFFMILEAAVQALEMRLHAYCILPSGYHLLIETPRANLSQCMRFINGRYAQWLRSNDQLGGVGNDRYQAWLLDPALYLNPVSVVIHQYAQSVTGDLNWQHYRWSSVRVYLGKVTPPSWLTTQPILSSLSAELYAGLMRAELPMVVQRFYALKRKPAILGHADFCDQVAAKVAQQLKSTVVVTQKTDQMAAITRLTADYFHVSVSQVKAVRRGSLNVPRHVAIYLSRVQVKMPLIVIAQYFGLSTHSAVSNLLVSIRQRLLSDATMIAAIKQIGVRYESSMVTMGEVGFLDWLS